MYQIIQFLDFLFGNDAKKRQYSYIIICGTDFKINIMLDYGGELTKIKMFIRNKYQKNCTVAKQLRQTDRA